MRNHLFILLSVVFFLYPICANAQFASSETVYCYVYDYSDNDGIKSRIGASKEVYFVNFQNSMLGFYAASSLSSVQKKCSNLRIIITKEQSIISQHSTRNGKRVRTE